MKQTSKGKTKLTGTTPTHIFVYNNKLKMVLCIRSNLPFVVNFDNNLPKFFTTINVLDHLKSSWHVEEKLDEDDEIWGLKAKLIFSL